MRAVGVLIKDLAAAALVDAADLPLALELGQVAIDRADADPLAAQCRFYLLGGERFVRVL